MNVADALAANGRFVLTGCEPVPEPDVIQWGAWFEHADHLRVVARTPLPCGHIAVTYFTAMAPVSWMLNPSGRLFLFELHVNLAPPMDDWLERFETWEEAFDGHVAFRAARLCDWADGHGCTCAEGL